MGQPSEVIRQSIAFLLKEEAAPRHPYWPGGKSGITIGVGWDIGQHTDQELTAAWADLPAADRERLLAAVGITGAPARALLPPLSGVMIPPEISRAVLSRSVQKEWYARTLRVFPGADALPTEVQVALLSVLFNRGTGTGHEPDWLHAIEVDPRWEMREIRRDVRDRDLFALYAHLDTMKRLWEGSGPRGLPIRRRSEGHLIKPYVDQQLAWEALQAKARDAGQPPCSP
jgi:hypothetical protein